MDILSLPNEMLTSVLKYLPHEPLQKVCRINRRFDEISKRNGLNRLVLNNLTISVYNDAKFWIRMEPNLRYYDRDIATMIERQRYNGISLTGEDASQLVGKALNKIRKVGKATFLSITINEEMVTTILKYARIFRNPKLLFSVCQLDILIERMKNFVNALKVTETTLSKCQFRTNNSITDKVVADFNPSMNIVFFDMDCSLLTIDSLYKRIYFNRLNISIGLSTTSIAFWDMITFLKTNKTIKNDIAIGEVHGAFNKAAEVEEILTKEFNADDIWQCLYYFSFRPYPNQGLVKFKIRFLNIGE